MLIKFIRDKGFQKAGSVVEYDDARAESLIEKGICEKVKAPSQKPAKVKTKATKEDS